MDKLRQLAIVSRNRIHQRFVSGDLTPEPMGVQPVFDEPLPGGVPFDQLVKVSGPRIGVDLLSNLTDLGVVQKQGRLGTIRARYRESRLLAAWCRMRTCGFCEGCVVRFAEFAGHDGLGRATR